MEGKPLSSTNSILPTTITLLLEYLPTPGVGFCVTTKGVKMEYIVYMHTCPNKKVYIGITSLSTKERWKNGKGYKSNNHFTNAIEKYGWENITHSILFSGLTKQEAEKIEIELIKKYDSTNPQKGYNLRFGGNATSVSSEIRQKMSKSHIGLTASDETKKKLSAAKSGKNNPFYGKKLTEKQKQLLKSGYQKYMDIPGVREKRADVARKLWENEEFRIMMSETNKGKNNYFYGKKFCGPLNANFGKKMPRHVADALSAANSKKIICLELNKIYSSASDAAKDMGCTVSAISHAAKGKVKTCCGFHWEYCKNE